MRQSTLDPGVEHPLRPARHEARPRWLPDAASLLILILGFVAVALILSPARSHAVADDWIYAQATRRLQLSGAFGLHDWTQASLAAQAWWGRLFAVVFGYSQGTLVWSTIVLSWVAVLCCFGLARRLGCDAIWALFAAFLLFLNPVYLHLSYSFMTDVPMIALALASCLCGVIGLQRANNRMLFAASLLSGIAGLVRQPGVLVAVALLIVLITRRELSRERFLITLVPLCMVGVYQLWVSAQPLTPAQDFTAKRLALTLSDPRSAAWSLVFGSGLTFASLGFWALPLLPFAKWRRPSRRAAQGAAVLGFALMFPYALMVILGRGLWPLDLGGSMLRSAGFIALTNTQAPAPGVLNSAAWILLSITSIAGAVTIGVATCRRLLSRVKSWRSAPALGPRDFLYLSGALMSLCVLPSLQLMDRYLLPLLPAIIIWMLPHKLSGSRARTVAALCLFVGLGLFSLLAEADFHDRATAGWAAAESLLAHGVPYYNVTAGGEWNGAHYYDEQGFRRGDGRLFGEAQPRDTPFVVAEGPVPGYRVIGRQPYLSRLGGWSERSVFVLAKSDASLPDMWSPGDR